MNKNEYGNRNGKKRHPTRKSKIKCGFDMFVHLVGCAGAMLSAVQLASTSSSSYVHFDIHSKFRKLKLRERWKTYIPTPIPLFLLLFVMFRSVFQVIIVPTKVIQKL